MTTDTIKAAISRESLIQHYEELQLIYRTAPLGLALLDTNHRYIRVNEYLAQINDLSIEEHIGRSIFDVVPDIAPKVKLIHDRVIETGETSLNNMVQGIVPSDPDRVRFYLTSYIPLKVSGVVQGISVVVQDITEQKETEISISRYHQFQEFILSGKRP